MSLGIIALRTRNNEFEGVVLELLSKAKRIYNGTIEVILPVGNSDATPLVQELERYGANKIYLLRNEKLKNYDTRYYQKAILDVVSKINPEILLIGATANGRDLAPRISAALCTGLTADCTELAIDENGKLAATRPTYGGSLMATILSRKTPQMATVRPKVFQKSEENFENRAEVEEIAIDLSDTTSAIKELKFTPKTSEDASIEEAEIIVAGGKGVKTQENFDLLKEFADSIGAKVACTRGLVDAGFCLAKVQVGQTGKTVTPKIYIACGISGAIQHIEGMKNSGIVIAINKDPNAPIFKVADYKIVGDLAEILPKLIEEAKRN